MSWLFITSDERPWEINEDLLKRLGKSSLLSRDSAHTIWSLPSTMQYLCDETRAMPSIMFPVSRMCMCRILKTE